jgi:hypothetical protein
MRSGPAGSRVFLPGDDKVLVDLGCSSHNAMWEKNRTLLSDASVAVAARWPAHRMSCGIVRTGY